MQLRQITGTRPSDEQLLDETSYALAAGSLANKAFGSGAPALSSLIEESAEFYKAPRRNNIYGVFIQLRDHAYDDKPNAEISDTDVYHAFAFTHAMTPVAEFFSGASSAVFEQILNAAFARDKLHEFVGDRTPVICSPGCEYEYDNVDLPSGLAQGLTIYELALLSQMREQSVRNALQRDPSIPKSTGKYTKQVEVPIKEAFEWLKTREGFRWYRPAENSGDIMVPVARDGSFFSSKCRQGKGFAVGKKGEEKYYDTMRGALHAIEAMDAPYWRRPSAKSGVPGIVKGVGWVAKSPKELGIE